MTGRDRVALHAQRTGWEHVGTASGYSPVITYRRGPYELRVICTASNAIARARITDTGRPELRARWISGGSGRADRIIDWMLDPAAVFA